MASEFCEVQNLITDLSPKKAPNIDGISSKILIKLPREAKSPRSEENTQQYREKINRLEFPRLRQRTQQNQQRYINSGDNYE
ncbi:hypothetical protein EVAR_90878_1 [Eumeta japonica]|uniref:Uncharacterized protein n=1 Tax=Eumeta variegata TaxID=151549 RepID=A0A4C2ACP2_EUMVA|nr:hypothetical protein EVAR_90878_1 [Eumeta japonica]